ncbi:major facilitator superfamily domain-containing protein [Annulohypoxylon maeteangense]|uniref:major facilitator superfamily domain-containing protein n=1 Tax=Annulohypoxylon maeteangense TaxID=1927788 RepID=UPI002007D445|nr:major facilitator superfamily domain-containing protein [Annulohypoxylon maeteangense]KAI0885552.1 major facilitator superfamily domain-containing protein [Annulohypoxylon maeteangense]
MAGLKKTTVARDEPLSISEGRQSIHTTRMREHFFRQQEPQGTDPPVHPIMALFRRKQQHNPCEIATQPSVFDDPERARYFHPTENYEGIHRFDPEARWTWAEELPLINKLDRKITLWAWIAVMCTNLDSVNISQANTDNFLDDLGLSTDDFNLGNTAFKVAFICASLPSQLISKKVGHRIWIPTIMCSWSVVALSQFWLRGRTSFLICRVLLGLLEGGFPSIILLYLSYFFKGTELPVRLAIFYTSINIVYIVAPILALGILRLRGYHGQAGWRWLFLIEGIITFAGGVWSWFAMASSPTQTRSWYRPKGWFSEREEVIMVNRILRDDPSKGDMNTRQGVDLKGLWMALCDFDLWPIYIASFVYKMVPGVFEQYLTLVLRDLGFDTFNSNLLAIPAQVAGIFTTLIPTYLSEIWDERSLMSVFAQVWILPNIIALAVLPNGTSPWTKYAIMSIVISRPYLQGMQIAWGSRNSNAVGTRTVSVAVANMFAELSGVVYSNIYRADDRPECTLATIIFRCFITDLNNW